MSKTLSKIMVICALAVIIPLMVIGTAFAAYYSVNTLVSIDVYADARPQQGAYAKVVYDGKENDTKFDVNQSHLKTLTLKAVANGYNFLGWYDGTTKNYDAEHRVDPTQIEFFSTDANISVKMTEYDDILAVFEIKTYAVAFEANIDADLAEAEETAIAGRTTFSYGDKLPEPTKAHWVFKGWKVNGGETLYKYATFDIEDNIELSGVWEEAEQYTVRFVYGDNELGTITKYSDEKVVFPEITLDENGKLTTFDAIADADRPVVDNGHKFVWKVNGAPAQESETAATVALVDELVVYTIEVNGNEDAAYSPNQADTLNFTIENKATALAPIFDQNNWFTEYSFWKFEGITFNAAVFADVNTLVDAVVEASKHAETTIAVEANIHKYFTSVASVQVTYWTEGNTEDLYNEHVWTYDRDAGYGWVETGNITLSATQSTTNLATWLYATKTEVRKGSEYGEILSLYKLVYVSLGIQVIDYTTLNDLIEYLYEDNPAMTLTETFTFQSFKVLFN